MSPWGAEERALPWCSLYRQPKGQGGAHIHRYNTVQTPYWGLINIVASSWVWAWYVACCLCLPGQLPEKESNVRYELVGIQVPG